ncbi:MULTISPECIES: DsbE family thiol:disulfide interchange protein [Methylosinus]|uniref:DsbE family thiol:disulfide interchange protein n=1 Tax=Methylosinus trichosporium (strain ATCC 35070 / NCIMB 11131 / UNIQEM 75 / OB3b) TaxID=595536 RepID=A0A2D2D4A4_METT3|nr:MULTISPECIES: DsbE family thiol:disulfide interchange protein [Methylosinus]ATQ69840.1 DsbE family thiol:disulfide interchange protein [Methylosinus trichosporium OB3b]OBS52361.1 thiol:disulfide interchange protein [Methylosinus sp. 3S-1]
MSVDLSGSGPAPRRGLALFLPLAVFLLLAVLFFFRLFAGDASRLPSALIGKQAPAFALPALAGFPGVGGLSGEDLRKGRVSVVNVFASWCAPCREEHAQLMALAGDARLAQAGVALAGLAYKDDPSNSRRFLEDVGNPYGAIGVDLAGRVAIDFGVYGVPETFVVRGDGTIAFKFVGPLTRQAMEATLMPEIEKAAR